MKSVIKWGAIIVGCLVVVIIAALLLIPRFVDVQKYKPVLESKVTEATGRPFSVGDDLSLSLFPWAGVSFSDLRLGNPAGFSEKEFVTVKSFEVRIKLLPLLSKDIQIKRFVVNAPHIVLVKNKNGRTNWEQPQQPSKETPTGKKEEAPVIDSFSPEESTLETKEDSELASWKSSLQNAKVKIAEIDHSLPEPQ